ncbi:MAG TPA: hypothetical protein VMU36_14455 [Spirochaetia bacterium]|nr:hypothetical protein [Spirochaetia bacterium]
MAQFYLLSVLSNMIAGLTLAGEYLGEKIPFLASFKNLRANRHAQVIIALVTVVTGIIKLIVLSPSETIPVVGDILPALTGIVVGAILLVESFRTAVESKGEQLKKISTTVLTYRVPVGIAAVVIAIPHFLFPGVPVL